MLQQISGLRHQSQACRMQSLEQLNTEVINICMCWCTNPALAYKMFVPYNCKKKNI